jgi:hypothetical protein
LAMEIGEIMNMQTRSMFAPLEVFNLNFIFHIEGWDVQSKT